jgi:hypothetical protein
MGHPGLVLIDCGSLDDRIIRKAMPPNIHRDKAVITG